MTLDPPHTRLEGQKLRHLITVLKELWQMKGQKGFDIFRNAETKDKDALLGYLRRNYTPEEIDEAHWQCVKKYPNNGGFGRRGRGSRNGSGDPDPNNPFAAAVGNNFSPSSDPAGAGQSGQQANGGNGAQAGQSGQQSSGQQAQASQGNAGQQSSGLTAQQLQGLQQAAANAQPQPNPSNPNDPMYALAVALWPYLKPPVGTIAATFDAGMMLELGNALKQIAANGNGNGMPAPTVVAIQTPQMPAPKNLGVQHKQFPLLLKACNARQRNGHRLNLWLYGPAGSGKTTAAEKVAEALGLPFRYNGACETKYDLLGFIDANGRLIRTPFRDAWEHGGIYLFDEIDASQPGALLALNGALANGIAPFQDGMIPRHPDCVVIAGANTTGMGATVEYVGRMKQDASLVDRFSYIDWPIDEALEASLCADKAWLDTVRAVRRNVKSRNQKNIHITPRAVIYGEALLAAGIDRETVKAMTMRKGAADDAWAAVKA